MTDAQKIALVEAKLDGTLTLETAKLFLGINHSDSDNLLRLLVESFNLNEDRSGWGL